MIKILGKTSSINVRKTLWVCEEMGVAFEQEEWGEGFISTDHPDFHSLNPNATVPVLIDGDFVLWESNSICRYLASSYKGHDLYSSVLKERALIEQWMDWQATDFNAAWRYAFTGLVREGKEFQDRELQQASIVEWNNAIKIIAAQIEKTGAYLTGENFTLADIVIGLSINRWLKSPIERIDYPEISNYMELLGKRPSFSKYMFDI